MLIPTFPRKVFEGKEDEIVPCIACNVRFSRGFIIISQFMCSVRPTVGREGQPEWGYYGFTRQQNQKSGYYRRRPSRITMCCCCPEGHQVSLFRKDASLGGSINLASQVDHGAIELLRPINTLRKECQTLVLIKTGTPMTEKHLSGFKLRYTCHSNSLIRKLPFVFSGRSYSPRDIIAPTKPPKRTAIIGGNGRSRCRCFSPRSR